MPDIASLWRNGRVEATWVVFALGNLVAMVAWPRWETIPFHFIWVSLTIVFGFRIWAPRPTSVALSGVGVTTGLLIAHDVHGGAQQVGELFEVPLMGAMFLAMVWHARRRQHALSDVERLLERQERFLHDASHELRTPATIVRGHLDLLRTRSDPPELAVALDELDRMERILDRLLLLAKTEQPDFVVRDEVELETFLEDVFLRWAEVAPRAWRLGPLVAGSLFADRAALRAALDALLENAVKYTGDGGTIELWTRRAGDDVVIQVRDDGSGIPTEALDRIFDRFARADAARTREQGGVGLGLSIADAITRAHGGHCSVESRPGVGSTFALRLPGFRPQAAFRTWTSASTAAAASSAHSGPPVG